jgi:hypothetical protein
MYGFMQSDLLVVRQAIRCSLVWRIRIFWCGVYAALVFIIPRPATVQAGIYAKKLSKKVSPSHAIRPSKAIRLNTPSNNHCTQRSSLVMKVFIIRNYSAYFLALPVAVKNDTPLQNALAPPESFYWLHHNKIMARSAGRGSQKSAL